MEDYKQLITKVEDLVLSAVGSGILAGIWYLEVIAHRRVPRESEGETVYYIARKMAQNHDNKNKKSKINVSEGSILTHSYKKISNIS